MHHPVADRGDLVDVLENPDFGVKKGFCHQVDGHSMVRAIEFLLEFLLPGDFVDDKGAADGDALHQPLGDDFLLIPVEQLILYR